MPLRNQKRGRESLPVLTIPQRNGVRKRLLAPFLPWIDWLQWVPAGPAFALYLQGKGSIYGTIFGPSTGQLAVCNWSLVNLSSLAAILISPCRGLLVYQPWILLAALSLFPSLGGKTRLAERASCPAGWVGFCLCVIVLHLALISSWKCWWGGYCWGSRLAAEAVPLLALLCVRPIALLWHTGSWKGLVISLAVLSSLLHMPAIYLRSAGWNGRVDVDHHPERLWSWSDPPFLNPLLH